MSESHIPIGQVKRDISELVNRVAYRGERIVLTSRGKPKAALVSMEDYERLTLEQASTDLQRMQAWLAATAALSDEVLARRGGEMIDVDEILRQDRQDLEDRDGWVTGDRGC